MAFEFEHLGFFLEYYVDGVFIGTKNIEEADRELIGYYSRKNHVAKEAIKIGNKTIKAGTRYYTRMYPLCGKRINKFNCKVRQGNGKN